MAEQKERQWQPLNPALAAKLGDGRRQLHHAAQLAAAFGISYLAKRADDSHTNLEWIESDGSLASHSSNGTRVAVRVRDLTLVIGGESFSLRGKTMDDAAEWIRAALAAKGFDPSQLTLARHYEIPSHPVGSGVIFDARDEELAELERWFSNSAYCLGKIRSAENGSEVRCWPHHFDIATLIQVSPTSTVVVGMEPGDEYYDEPYFYVNMNPIPARATLPPTLGGDGRWNTRDWIGAVLTAHRLTPDVTKQQKQVTDFLASAVETCTRLVVSD